MDFCVGFTITLQTSWKKWLKAQDYWAVYSNVTDYWAVDLICMSQFFLFHEDMNAVSY